MPSPSITTILPIGIFIAIPVPLFILWVVYQKIQKQKAVQREQQKLAPGPNSRKNTLSTLTLSRLNSIQSCSPPTPGSLATTNPVSPTQLTTPTTPGGNPSTLLKTGHYLTAKRSEGGVVLLEDGLDPAKSENSTSPSLSAPDSSLTQENRKSLDVINEEEETDSTVKVREKRLKGHILSPDKSENANNDNQQLQAAEQYLRVNRHEKGKGVILSTNDDRPDQTDSHEPLPTDPAPMSPPMAKPQVGKATPSTSKEGEQESKENLNNVIIRQLKVPPPSAAIHNRKSHRSSTDSGVLSPRNTENRAQNFGVDNPVFVFPDIEEKR